MSDVGQLPAMNAAMATSVAVLKAAQDMAANTVALVATSVATSTGRAPLPYSKMLDKLA